MEMLVDDPFELYV